MTIRDATIDDSQSIHAIYAEYIDSNITFETAMPTAEAFRLRMAAIIAKYPYLVAVDSGQVIGYAYAHELRERQAYQWSAELSIYFTAHATGRGLGRMLYLELLERLRHMGLRNAFGCVTLPNPASERLHLSLGFKLAGRFADAGFKNGQWHDVAWFQKQIGPGLMPAPSFRNSQA